MGGRPSLVRLGVGVLLGAGALAGLLGVGWTLSQYVKFGQAAGTPPLAGPTLTASILIAGEPPSGPVGEPINVQVFSSGPAPIVRNELWVDGGLAATHAASSAPTHLFSELEWTPDSPGFHLLSARSMDADGSEAISNSVLFWIDGTEEEGAELQADGLVGAGEPPAEAEPAQPWQASPGDWIENLMSDQVPAAPSLSAGAGDCAVDLLIHDLSENEAGFTVHRQLAIDSSWTELAKLDDHDGQGWIAYQDSVVSGGASYYVAAYNDEGQALSSLVVMNVPGESCPDETVPLLSIQLEKLTADASANQAYCYVSFDGLHWQRWPEFGFLGDDQGGFDAGSVLGSIVLEGPDGAPLAQPPHLQLECWGWQGADLIRLGSLETGDLGNRLPQVKHIDGEGIAADVRIDLPLIGNPWFGKLEASEDLLTMWALTQKPTSANIPYLHAWVTDDPDVCGQHLASDEQNPFVILVVCAGYPGYNMGPGGAVPQLYLVWSYLDHKCEAGTGPANCLPYWWWMEHVKSEGGLLYFEIEDAPFAPGSVKATYTMNHPDRSVLVLPPPPVSEGANCADYSESRFARVRMVYQKPYSASRLRGPWSEWAEMGCNKPLHPYEKIRIYFGVEALTLSDVEDTDGIMEIFGHLGVGWSAPYAVFIPNDDALDMDDGNYPGQDLYLCSSYLWQGVQLVADYGCGTGRNVFSVAVDDNDSLTLTARLYDDDSPLSPDDACLADYYLERRSRLEWAEIEGNAYTLTADHEDSKCQVVFRVHAIRREW